MPLLVAAVLWLRGSGVSANAARVLVDLVEHCDKTTGIAYPSLDCLSRNTDLNRRTLQRALAELVRHPAKPIEQRMRGHHATAAYVVTDVLRRSWKELTEGRHHRHVTGDASPKTCQEATSGATPVTRRGDMGVASIKEELTQGTYPEKNPAPSAGAVTPVEVLTPGQWPSDWTDRLFEIWRPHGVVNFGRLKNAVKPMVGRWPLDEIERGLAAFLAAGKAAFGPENFAQAAGDWIRGGPATAGRQSATAATADMARRWAGGAR